MSKVILITGCSTGIGRDLACRLASAGYVVVATARRLEALSDLEAALKLELDVSSPDSVSAAVGQVTQRFGRIDMLINNAGYALRGAVEEIPVDEFRKMLDVNVLGAMRMIQAVVPHMRAQRAGRIINISSVAGKFFTPANGTYSATKFALEALSDALRVELCPFNIQVILIEPGSIKTQFHATVEANAQEIFGNPLSPYRALYQEYERVNTGMRRGEPGPEVVSHTVQRAIEAPTPKARYMVAFGLTGRLLLHLGDPAWDAVVRRLFKIQPAALHA